MGAALRCASLCAAGMLAALLLEKSLPEDETLAQRLSVPGKTRAAALRGALATTAAIVLHNLPEGILTLFTNAADSAWARPLHWPLPCTISRREFRWPCRSGTTGSRRKAFQYTLISGLAEPVGALLAFLVLRPFINDLVLGLLFGAVAGIMVYISVEELIPSSRQYGYDRAGLLAIFTGVCLMPLTHLL